MAPPQRGAGRRQHSDHGHQDDHDDGRDEDGASAVRPYAVTGGRTAVAGGLLPIEALVQGLVEPDVQLTPERRRILELTASQYLSVAELSAHLRLPLGVVRVLVSDLAETSKVRVHGLSTSTSAPGSAGSTASALSVLESVLNGISAL